MLLEVLFKFAFGAGVQNWMIERVGWCVELRVVRDQT